jgi:hypothetical protein
MKRAFQKRSLEQLRSETWPDKAAAIRDLKRNGFAESGDDYAVGEYKPGAWMVLANKSDQGKGKAKPAQTKSKPAASGVKSKPASQKTETPPEPVPEPAVEAVPPGTDLSPLPASDGPYEIAIREGEAESFPKHAAHTAAMDISRRIKGPVYIRDRLSKVVRMFDYAAYQNAHRGSGAVGRRGTTSTTGKSAEAGRLLLRDNGATFAELVAVTEWSFGESYIQRLGRANSASVEKIGHRHWRLIKR